MSKSEETVVFKHPDRDVFWAGEWVEEYPDADCVCAEDFLNYDEENGVSLDEEAFEEAICQLARAIFYACPGLRSVISVSNRDWTERVIYKGELCNE